MDLPDAFALELGRVSRRWRTRLDERLNVTGLTPGTWRTLPHLSHAAPLPDLQQAAAVWFLGQTIYAQANILAYRDGFLITAIVFAAALLPTWLVDRAQR